MPVYNGENYIEEALDSILAQTYADFELIISDNASTDRTQEICQSYATRDRRIRYYRNKGNIGVSKNFNRVFELSIGKYFKWIAHDDIYAPDYLSKCVRAFEQDPSLVLCHTLAKRIDSSGRMLGSFKVDPDKLASPKPRVRFGHLLLTDRWPYEIFGLMQASILRSISLHGDYAGTDSILRATLGLTGRFFVIPEYLFFFREHSSQSGISTFDPANTGRFAFPNWRMFMEYIRCVRHSSLSWIERIGCYLHTARWVAVNWNWGRMILDLILAAEPRFWNAYVQIRQWFIIEFKKGKHLY